MKKILAILIAVSVTITFSQTCFAQFDKAATGGATKPATTTPPAGSANPGGGVKSALKTGTIPTTKFTDALNGLTLESNGGVTPGLAVLIVDRMGLAERNGLEPGDIIASVNGRAVSTSRELQNAFQSIPVSSSSVPMTIVNVRNGLTQHVRYELTTDAGMYQTNFGRIELTQTPTNTTGVSLLEGTLHFYHGTTAHITGTLSGNSFRGTSTSPTGRTAPFELTRTGNIFDGHVTQGVKHRFVFVKRN